VVPRWWALTLLAGVVVWLVLLQVLFGFLL
jgi:hypothetical protein